MGEFPLGENVPGALPVQARTTESESEGGINPQHACAAAHPHTQTTCALYFPPRRVKHALLTQKLPSKNSHFLTPSNHISQKCLLTGSAYLSQNLSHV